MSGETAVIQGTEAHHITAVFRLKIDDEIILVDGTGVEYKARITETGRHRVLADVYETYTAMTESPIKLMVGQGYLKDKKMDMLVRHLTEIGVTHWMPVRTAYSVPQPDRKSVAAKMRRWEAISRESVKQCGRTRPPEIGLPLTLPEALAQGRDMEVKIIFYENENQPFADTMKAAAPNPSGVMALFGPEGGFSEDEVRQARAAGFITASLGPRIMRAETASIAACTLIQHLFGDMP